MKSKIIRNYFIRLLCFTGIYAGAIVVADEVFNGVVLDYLDRKLPMNGAVAFTIEKS